VLHATNLRIPIVEVEGGSLTALAGFDGHQGVALVVEPRRFASLDDVLARAAERDEPPFILVLDSLEDPHNVGTLLRSAEAAGVHGVLFPTHRQAPLSPSAVKASAGAIEHLLLCPVDDLPGALSDLHTRGVRIAGAEGDAPMTARQSDLRGPLAIVVGSEGQGLGPAVRRRADLFMRIPMKGAVGSLNAAVAGSILLFEALAQRDPNATPRVTPAHEREEAAPSEKAQKRRARKSLSTESLGVVDEASEASEAVVPAEAPPKRRARKGLSTEPPDVIEEAASDATAPVEAKPTRRARKAPSVKSEDAPLTAQDGDAAAAAAQPKPTRRSRKTVPADPAPEAGMESPDEDLLPTDRPRKRSPRAR
jgi:23S rRNA (guanosine2251-2'-O)-methyltransferase